MPRNITEMGTKTAENQGWREGRGGGGVKYILDNLPKIYNCSYYMPELRRKVSFGGKGADSRFF